MRSLKTIFAVDDNTIGRIILSNIRSEQGNRLKAKNRQAARALLPDTVPEAIRGWNFASKPDDAEIILFRPKNVSERSPLSAIWQLQYLSEYDALIGFSNKTKLFDATRAMLDASRDECFVFFRFDADRFQQFNASFATAEGDKLLNDPTDRTAENKDRKIGEPTDRTLHRKSNDFRSKFAGK